MKKFVSLILSLTFILGLLTVNTFAYTRPENIVSEFNDFENVVLDDTLIAGQWGNFVGDWGNGTTPADSVSPQTASEAELSIGSDSDGKYLVASLSGVERPSICLWLDYVSASKAVGGVSNPVVPVGSYFAFEFDFKLPSSTTSTKAMNISIWDAAGSRNRTTVASLVPSTCKFTAGTNSYTISKDVWYKMKLECVVGSPMQRFIIMDKSGKELFVSNMALNVSNNNFYGWIAINGGNKGDKFYFDNTKAYTFDGSDLNVGRNTCTDNFEKYTETASDAARPTSANGTGSWYYWGSDLGSANKRQIAIVSEEDKYVRIISDVAGAHSYTDRIAFGIPVSNKADVFGTATVQNPLLIGFKLRVADTSLIADDEIRISIYNPTSKVRDTITSILPAGNAVAVGGTPDIVEAVKGLNLSRDKWYDVKIYQNDTTDYQRVEITNLEDNKTQIFEGTCTYDFSDFSILCFDATCYGKTRVDFDDVVITALSDTYTQKLVDISNFAVDKDSVEVGEITASVDVKTYSYAEDIVTDTAKLILASYDENGCLAGLQITDVKPMGGKYTVTLNVPDASYDVKAMLWSASSEGMNAVPLAEHIPLN